MKTAVIKRYEEFVPVMRKGMRCADGNIAVFYKENGLGRNRCGINVGKKIGNAVARNRAKRVVRAAVYETFNLGVLPIGYDFIFIPAKNAADEKICKSTDIKKFILEKLVPNMLKSVERRNKNFKDF